METIPPRRDHGASTFWPTWDENGEETHINRVPDHSQGSVMEPSSRQARQTVKWPFSKRGKSIATVETAISSQLLGSSVANVPLLTRTLRPVTWEPKRMLPLLRRDSSFADTDLVPDYVINYIRGETPETVARRKNNHGKIGERGVDVVTQHKPQQSRAADFEGFYDDASSTTRHENSFERLQGWGDDAEDSRILSGGDGNVMVREKGWRRFAVGWRGGLALNLLLTCLVLMVGIVCLIMGVSRGSSSAGEAVIFSGSCSTSENMNLGLHILVSVFGVVLLAGANYAFQALSSPTRKEVDAAHAQRKWLDIGVPSFRNFASVGKSRRALFVALLLVTMATQVMYNAVIFTSRAATDTKMLMVTQSFLTGAPFTNNTSSNEAKLSHSDIYTLQNLAVRGNLDNVTATNCKSHLGKEDASNMFQTDYEAILMVNMDIKSTSSSKESSIIRTSSYFAQQLPDEYLESIGYCLFQEATAPPACSVNLHTSLLGVVTLLNFLSAIILAFLLLRPNFDPLVSLGDAISSFLQRPDMTTTRSCLLTKSDVTNKLWGVTQAKYWAPRNHYWFRSPSIANWATTLSSWAILTALSAAALNATILTEDGDLSSLGSTSTDARIMTMSPLRAAVVSCLPQLLLVVLYISTNSLMTTYYLAHEASQFALGVHRPLRVTSCPQGCQAPSLYLTLPRPWSWFLITVFIGLSFVLSQAVFPISVRLPSPINGESSPTAIGVSGTGLLALICLLAFLLLVVLGLGFRRAEWVHLANGQAVSNPLALRGGSCSAVFSAWCQPSVGEKDAWRQQVAWGVVDGEMGSGSHCTFTAGKPGRLDLARSYI